MRYSKKKKTVVFLDQCQWPIKRNFEYLEKNGVFKFFKSLWVHTRAVLGLLYLNYHYGIPQVYFMLLLTFMDKLFIPWLGGGEDMREVSTLKNQCLGQRTKNYFYFFVGLLAFRASLVTLKSRNVQGALSVSELYA